MSSESNPFYRVAQQKNSNPFYQLAQKQKDYRRSIGHITSEEREGMEAPYGIASTVVEHPAQAAASIPGQALGFLESVQSASDPFQAILRASQGRNLVETPITEAYEKVTGISDLPEEHKENLDIMNMVLGAMGIGPEVFAKMTPSAQKYIRSIASKLKKSSAPRPPPPSPPPAPSAAPISGTAGRTPILEHPFVEKTKSDLKELGSKVKERIFGPDISIEIPKSISPEKFRNTTKGGMELERAVSSQYKKLSNLEKKAYEKSRVLNRNVEAIHPDLEMSLRNSLEELEKIPDPSAPLKRFIESTRKVLSRISERAPSGELIGYKPISNQVLIDQIQEYNQIPKFDFPTDTKTGIFKTLINKLTEAVDKTAAKSPQANRAWKQAKELHARKSDLFGDADVSKWTKLADKNYSKEFISSIDIDKIRKLAPILKESSHGRGVLQKMKRDLVEKMFEDYFPVGKRFEKKEIAAALAELEPILTKTELKVVERLFEEAQTPGAKAASLSYKFYKYFRRPAATALREISSAK
jgi:hypothetical protein